MSLEKRIRGLLPAGASEEAVLDVVKTAVDICNKGHSKRPTRRLTASVCDSIDVLNELAKDINIPPEIRERAATSAVRTYFQYKKGEQERKAAKKGSSPMSFRAKNIVITPKVNNEMKVVNHDE
jgi:hypothetical protein